jgi:NAD(P)-dependent dehydrogenase (short-subunit alcohol dehydrogenase family)
MNATVSNSTNVLKGQVAWITGGGSGIGLAAALALAEAGARVIISGRRGALLEEALPALRKAGAAQATALTLDVADCVAIENAARVVENGHGRVDILVNSAGINVPNRTWSQITASDFARVVQINLNGAMAACQAVIGGMRARGSGLIINVSSWAGRYDSAFTGPAYNASKHGLLALTATLNMDEGRHGIRACALCPAEVATPILKSRPVPPSEEDMARMLQPADLGTVVRFLAELPAHVCVNELVISPTWNRAYLGFAEMPAQPLGRA